MKENKINDTVLLSNEKVFNRFKGMGIPDTLLLDWEQRIVQIYRGPIPDGSLEAVVQPLS